MEPGIHGMDSRIQDWRGFLTWGFQQAKWPWNSNITLDEMVTNDIKMGWLLTGTWPNPQYAKWPYLRFRLDYGHTPPHKRSHYDFHPRTNLISPWAKKKAPKCQHTPPHLQKKRLFHEEIMVLTYIVLLHFCLSFSTWGVCRMPMHPIFIFVWGFPRHNAPILLCLNCVRGTRTQP